MKNFKHTIPYTNFTFHAYPKHMKQLCRHNHLKHYPYPPCLKPIASNHLSPYIYIYIDAPVYYQKQRPLLCAPYKITNNDMRAQPLTPRRSILLQARSNAKMICKKMWISDEACPSQNNTVKPAENRSVQSAGLGKIEVTSSRRIVFICIWQTCRFLEHMRFIQFSYLQWFSMDGAL